MYITMDGGTTNTRLTLTDGKHISDKIKLKIGAGSCIDNKALYVSEIKNGIDALLKRNALTETQIECIIASGVITCEFGLCHLEHTTAPVGIEELHNALHKTVLSEITTIPFVFIRGVKTATDDFAKADMMRGEETEIMGLYDAAYGDCLYILPGSHSKLISVNVDGKIADFSTMLTGEMIAAFTKETVLKAAVDLNTESLSSAYLLRGYDYAAEYGINQALFKVRVLKNIFAETAEHVYSFFMGVVLCDEIQQIIKSGKRKIVIGGRKQIKEATALLLREHSTVEVIVLSDEAVDNATVLGAIRIYTKLF